MDARTILHVTNGDTAAAVIHRAGLSTFVLPWQDVLHEGPVPAGLAPNALAEVRAQFIAARGWASYESALADLRARDAALALVVASPGTEVVLWFESDLYDQLQLVQILDRLAGLGREGPALSCVDLRRPPGNAGFVAIGKLDVDQMRAIFTDRQPLTPSMLALGQAAWRAFTAADPTALEALLAIDTSALPDLADALRRHLEQFPATGDGLSRSERQLLEAVAAGYAAPVTAFVEQRRREVAPFLGDLAAWSYLAELASGPSPLLRRRDGRPIAPNEPDFPDKPLALTDAGYAVLSGRADRVALTGFDRWLGGVHLVGPTPAWRWDAAAGRLVAASA